MRRRAGGWYLPCDLEKLATVTTPTGYGNVTLHNFGQVAWLLYMVILATHATAIILLLRVRAFQTAVLQAAERETREYSIRPTSL